MAAQNKIRLMYFWADESVMAEDFRRKISKKMSEYARDFFGQNGFELDVKPGYEPGKVLQAQRFALVKNDGVRPDVELAEWLVLQNAQRVVDLAKEYLEAEDARDARRAEVDQLVAQQKAARAANDDAALRATVAPLEAAQKRLKEASDRLDEVTHRVLAPDKPDVEYAKADFVTQFRRQLGLKWVLGVTESKRLNVIFCKFVTHVLAMRNPRTSAVGMTIDGLDTPFLYFQRDWLWPAPFVCLSIDGAEPMNLSHEIVHAAGHGPEPPDVQTIKDQQKYLSYKPDPSKTEYENYVEYRSMFKVTPGGEFGGESVNDVMNYKADRYDPSATVLAAADKKLLEAAFFVLP